MTTRTSTAPCFSPATGRWTPRSRLRGSARLRSTLCGRGHEFATAGVPTVCPRCGQAVPTRRGTTPNYAQRRTRATCEGPVYLFVYTYLFTPSFQLQIYSSVKVSQFFTLLHCWNYDDHCLEITAMGEARGVTITAEQSTAAAGPALGVFRPGLGFFPALSFYLPDWKLSPLYFGFRGRAECANISHVCICQCWN
jgi:hypothetical protein